jgi:hypothetical protein
VEYHRPLTREDVETADRLLAMHQPMDPDSRGRSICASASHPTPRNWPCSRYQWAVSILAAHDRGEINF